MRNKRKTPLAAGLTALALAAAAPATLQAQEFFVVGNAQGCFGMGCSPSEAAATTLSGISLTYSSNLGSDFEGTTANGVLAINRTGTSTTGTFGSISVGTATEPTMISTPFRLLLSFVLPETPDQVFDAVISGVVRTLGTGGIVVDFDPMAEGPADVTLTSPWQAFFDPLTNRNGLLRTTVFGTPIPSGGTGDITGLLDLQATSTVPEPASMLLLGTGLAGMMGAARRRRKQSEDVA